MIYPLFNAFCLEVNLFSCKYQYIQFICTDSVFKLILCRLFKIFIMDIHHQTKLEL